MLYRLIGTIPRIYSVHRDGRRSRKVYDWPVIGAVQATSERQAIASFVEAFGARAETVRVQYAAKERQLEAFYH